MHAGRNEKVVKQPFAVIKVPRTAGGNLFLHGLDKEKRFLTRVSGYTVKNVEQAGAPLALMYPNKTSSGRYCTSECMVCLFTRNGRDDKRMVKSFGVPFRL